VQHWFPVVHVALGNAQEPLGASHLPVALLQFAVQHSVLLTHLALVALQVPAASAPREPSTIASTKLPSTGLLPS